MVIVALMILTKKTRRALEIAFINAHSNHAAAQTQIAVSTPGGRGGAVDDVCVGCSLHNLRHLMMHNSSQTTHAHTHTRSCQNFGQPIYNFNFRAHFRGCLCRGRALQVLAWGVAVAKLKTAHTHTLNMPQLGSCDRVRCLSLLPCRRSKSIFESFESSHSWNDVAVVVVAVVGSAAKGSQSI